MDILRNFDVILKNRGLTTDEVAKSLNITPQSLRTSLRGNPTITRLEAVAAALECPISDLLDLKDDGIFGMVKINGRIFTIQSRQELKGFVIYCRRRLEFWSDDILPPLKSYAFDSASALKIINSDLLRQEEMESILNATNFHFMDGFYFSSLADRLSIEISPERMTEKENMDISVLREGLRKAILTEQEAQAEYDRLRSCGAGKQSIEAARNKMLAIADSRGTYEWYLNHAKGKTVCLEHLIAGKFFPSSNPKIVLYLGSIREEDISPVAVLIHELFHAYFYFSSNQPAPVPEIEEPMAEFATLEFLSMVSGSLSGFEGVAKEYADSVNRKKLSIGRFCPYGFGHFLFKNVGSLSSFKPDEWANRYPVQSRYITAADYSVKIIQNKLSLIYPFMDEESIFFDFERLIFGTTSKKKAEGVAVQKKKEPMALKPRDAVLDSIKRIGKPDFTYEDIVRNIGAVDASDIDQGRERNLDQYDIDDKIRAGIISVEDAFKEIDSRSDEEKAQSSILADAAFYSRQFGWDKTILVGICTLIHEGILEELSSGHYHFR